MGLRLGSGLTSGFSFGLALGLALGSEPDRRGRGISSVWRMPLVGSMAKLLPSGGSSKMMMSSYRSQTKYVFASLGEM